MEDQQGLLEFGTSVSVNDELRRSLVSEAEDLQNSIQKIKVEIGLETKIRQQLTKDQAHAAAETQGLHRDSQEVHERLSIMHHQVFHDLYNNTLKRDLLSSSLTEESIASETDEVEDMTEGEDGEDDGEETKDENKSPAAIVNPHSMRGIRMTHAMLNEKVSMLGSFVRDAEGALENFKIAQHAAVSDKEQATQQVQQLQLDLSKSQETTQTFSRNWQVEEDRRHALENKLREMKLSYEAVLQETEEKVR